MNVTQKEIEDYFRNELKGIKLVMDKGAANFIHPPGTPRRLVWDCGDSFGSKLIFDDMVIDKSGRLV